MNQISLFKNSALIWHLSCGACAVALVGSLAFYQRSVLADPATVAKNHWDAIASKQTKRIVQNYRPDATLRWVYGSRRVTYRGSEIYQSWTTFLAKYYIQNYRILEKAENSDRIIKADILLAIKPHRGTSENISISYEAQIDEEGKILYEVWEMN